MTDPSGQAALLIATMLVEELMQKGVIGRDAIDQWISTLEATSLDMAEPEALAALKARIWLRLVIEGDGPVSREH